MKIVVGLSGGIDSTAALMRLREAGHEVIGVTLKNNEREDPYGKCCSLSDIQDAKRLCAQLGVQHYLLDVIDDFRESIINYFIREYEAGRTPNPCLHCNPLIKIKHLLRAADAMGAEKIATGHYARLGANGELLRPADASKDQTYFLSRLRREQLSRLMFPHADASKAENIELVGTINQRVAAKGESQEICFVPGNDYRKFLLGEKPDGYAGGEIVDETGEVVGEHQGLPLYTVGQRKGLGVAMGKPVYVRKLDVLNNRVEVGEPKLDRRVRLSDVNWLCEPEELDGASLLFQPRHRSKPGQASLLGNPKPGDDLELEMAAPQAFITPGQAGVAYLGDRVMFSGIFEPT